MNTSGLALLNQPLGIGNRRVDRRLNLAPLTFLGHVAFRELLSEFGGYGLLFTEMCSAKTVLTENRYKSPYFRWRDQERERLVCQIFGRDPDVMARAAARIQDEGFFGVDINLGCSAGNICKRQCGAALLKAPEEAIAMVTAVRRAVDIPLFVKYRIGWQDNPELAVELAKRFELEGVDALTFHPRVAPDRRARPPKWQYIGLVKEAVAIPVFGNGDVFDERDCARMLAQTGCDGIAIGRLAVAQPWIFAVWNKDFIPPADIHRQTAFRLLELLECHYEPAAALRRFYRFAYYFASNFTFGHAFYSRIRKTADLTGIAIQLDRFFESPPQVRSRLNQNYLL
jgi:nifR3 family TIM-barrel protein